MPLIKIVEQDLTSPGVLAQENDVVYIPGFVDTTQDSLNTEDGYVGIEAFKPTYFTDVKSFESLCGKQGAKFTKTQRYTDLIKDNGDGTYAGFSGKAIPQHRVMFYEGTVDPSYVMAKELLNAGLAVVYERINKDADYVKLTNKPEDWDNNYTSYYQDTPVYRPIVDTMAPELFIQHFEGETADVDGTYYSVAEVDDAMVYTKVNNEDIISGGVFTKTCYSQVVDEEGNPVKYYKFTHPTTEVTTAAGNSFESDTYYSITAVEAPLGADTYKKNTYYTLDKKTGVYSLSTSTSMVEDTTYYGVTYTVFAERPVEWGDNDANIYTATIEGTKLTAFTPVTFTGMTFAANTYYSFDEDTGYTLLTEEPEIFTPDTVFEVTEFPTSTETTVTIPSSWVVDFIDYSEKDVEKVLIESEDTIPTFESGKVFEISHFIDIASAYDALAKVFDASRDQGLADMGATNIKYLTSGGYPVYEYNNGSLVNAMKSVAVTRGDCVAFIDHTNNPYRTTNINLANSVYATVKADDSISVNGEFATMYTPWMNYTRVTTDTNEDGEASPSMITMSATYGYLLALADSLKTNASWLAVAGATRGQVPNLAQVATATPITNGTADAMQPRDGVSVNAITEINPYGQTIWGNRTLKNNASQGNLTATSFLNIRHLVSDVKKVCYATARALTFEQNNDVLWVNFKSKVSPTLDRMVSGYGISGYKIVRDTEHEKAAEKATLCAKIILYPTYAVEDFYITIVLTDEEVGVSE